MRSKKINKVIMLSAVAGACLVMGKMPDVQAADIDVRGVSSKMDAVIKESTDHLVDNINVFVINNTEGDHLNRAFGGTEGTIFETEIPDKAELERQAEIKRLEEEAARLAELQRIEEERRAIEEINNKRSSIVDFACQFIGNPYVYGGTSLTNGTDCSGFVMSVYGNFGYSLPRTTWAMEGSGIPVSADEATAGDLFLYEGHVGIYMGDGNIVHAADESTGITVGNAYYDTVKTIRRIIY